MPKRKRGEFPPCKFFFSQKGCSKENCRFKHCHGFKNAVQNPDLDFVLYSLEGNSPVSYNVAELPSKPDAHLRVVTCCCTHELHSQVSLPAGDAFFFCGDICNWRQYHGHLRTREQVWYDFALNFLQPNREHFPLGMFLTFGNHDTFAESNIEKVRAILDSAGCTVLLNESTTFSFKDYLDFEAFMSPVSFYRGKPTNAFQVNMRDREEYEASLGSFDDEYIESNFPKNSVDLLITHGPPFDDKANLWKGSEHLMTYVLEKKPRYVVYGDQHGGKGDISIPGIHWRKGICFANVALAGNNARFLARSGLARGPCVFDIPLRKRE